MVSIFSLCWDIIYESVILDLETERVITSDIWTFISPGFSVLCASVLCFGRDTDLLWLQVCFWVVESFSAGLVFSCSLGWKGLGSEVQGGVADIRRRGRGDPAVQALWAPTSLAAKHRDWANVSVLSSFCWYSMSLWNKASGLTRKEGKSNSF